MSVNSSAALSALVPDGLVTVTSTLLLPAGETAVIEVAELTVKLVAAVEPKRTAVAPVKLVPVMVTEVPPVEGPDTGLNALTVGAVGDAGVLLQLRDPESTTP